MTEITSLYIYPIKSCAAVAVNTLMFDQMGPVADRRFMLVDENGRFLTQRTLPSMAHIYPQINSGVLTVRAEGMKDLSLDMYSVATEHNGIVSVWKDEVIAVDCGNEAALWFASFLGRFCRLVMVSDETRRQVNLKYAREGEFVGFADGYPLLITSEESLQVLSSALDRPIDMLRFRPNIVVKGEEAFAELNWKRLSVASGGSIEITKPCERCVIPTRDIVTQQREKDMLEVLKQHCTVGGKIIFGQNALTRGIAQLAVGDSLVVGSE